MINLLFLALSTLSQTLQVLGAAYQADHGANVTNVSFADVFAAPGGPFRSLVRSVHRLTSDHFNSHYILHIPSLRRYKTCSCAIAIVALDLDDLAVSTFLRTR